MADTAPISLYLDLESGRMADLEVVARSSLAFAAMVREMAQAVDPFAEVRIEMESGTEGSLSINSLIRSVREGFSDPRKLKAIAIAVALWMGGHVADWTLDQIKEALAGPEHAEETQRLTDEELQALAEQVAAALHPRVAETPKEQIFREIERDPAIIAVGVSTKTATRPAVLVPRAEFPHRTKEQPTTEDAVTKRTSSEIMPVVLISPVLKDAERSWKFQFGKLPEFGAVMRDKTFLSALASGGVLVPLRPGVEMLIELETKEELEGESWTVKERNVLRVISPGTNPAQQSLSIPPYKPQPE